MKPLPLSKKNLISDINEGLKPKWLFFWGHQPSHDGKVTKSCFSQWWEGNRFEIEGVNYLTAEHYMMAMKALLFDDKIAFDQIIECKHPSEAKKLGRLVKNFDDEQWKANRFKFVVEGNIAKFGQNTELREFLIQTKNRILVEAAPRDRIWGIGMGTQNENAEKPENWRGLNLLGFALMAARNELTNP